MDNKEMNEVFSRRFRIMLAAKKVKQKELAEALGASRSTVSNWALGVGIPRMDKLREIAKFFDVSMGWLLGEDK